MADENNEVQAAETPARAPVDFNTAKMIIAGVVLIVVMAATSFGVAMFAIKSVPKGDVAKGDGASKAKSESIGTTFDAGEFITNLASEGGRSFIKVKIVLAFLDPKVQEELTNKTPEVQHTINSTLRQQTPEALSEPKGMEKLAGTLKKNINALLVKGNVTNVYFTSFVVQQ